MTQINSWFCASLFVQFSPFCRKCLWSTLHHHACYLAAKTPFWEKNKKPEKPVDKDRNPCSISKVVVLQKQSIVCFGFKGVKMRLLTLLPIFLQQVMGPALRARIRLDRSLCSMASAKILQFSGFAWQQPRCPNKQWTGSGDPRTRLRLQIRSTGIRYSNKWTTGSTVAAQCTTA